MLPSQLNLANNKPLSEGGKPFINRYRSDNSTYSAGDTIRLEIPCGRQGQFLFPNDSFLEARLKVNCSNGATLAGACFIDATVFSIFNRMRIIHGSTVLEDTLYCNRLWNAVYDVQVSESERRQDCLTKLINDNTALSASHTYNSCLQGAPIQSLPTGAAAADSTIVDFSIVLPSALLGSLASKALPLGLLNSSSIYLELELAPMNVAFVTESSSFVFNSYTIQDIYYNAKITQIPEDVNASLVASLGGDSIKLPAFAYKAELKSVAAGASAFNDKFAFNFSSVKSFYWWMTNQTTAVGANLKRSVTSRTKAGATDYYLTINGEAFPSQTISNPSRMYMELVRSWDGLVDTSFGGIISTKNYTRDTHTTADDIITGVGGYGAGVAEKRFLAGIDLDRFNHSSDTLNSGTSTIGQTVNLVVNYAAGLNESCNLYAAVMYDVIFVAENGQLSPRF
jgi:hypothetical protein